MNGELLAIKQNVETLHTPVDIARADRGVDKVINATDKRVRDIIQSTETLLKFYDIVCVLD